MSLRRADGFVRYAFSVQYHGASFLGFTYQGKHHENCILKDGTDLRGYQSVEGRLHEAFQTLVGHENYENIQVSSRTDRGVHALKNTCHVDVRCRRHGKATKQLIKAEQQQLLLQNNNSSMNASSNWDPQNLHRGLNYHLIRRQFQNNNEDNDDSTTGNKKHGRRHLMTNAASSNALDLRILSVVPAPQSMENKFYNLSNDPDQDKVQQQPKTIDWNARFSATQRTYVYRILNFTNEERDYGTPFEWDRSFRVTTNNGPLDIQAMQNASNFLIGTHDFTSFRGANCQRLSPFVTMNDIRIYSQPYGDGIIFNDNNDGYNSGSSTSCSLGEGGLLGMGQGNSNVNLITIMITGESFLYRQVRNMVGCLLDVGKGKISHTAVKDILEGRDRRHAPAMAPAHGLFLVDVKHGDFVF